MNPKDYAKNTFTEFNYNKFESDVYWGTPIRGFRTESFIDMLNLQHKVTTFNIVKNLTHNTLLEVGWTILPMFILLLIALPSMRLLYFMENPLRAILYTYDC
jgi:hypothetical protein